MDAIDLAGAAQFLLPHVGQVGGGGQVGLDDLARLPARGRRQVYVAAFGGILGQRAPRAKCLVVRMGKNSQ
jgi:hypothetical protein